MTDEHGAQRLAARTGPEHFPQPRIRNVPMLLEAGTTYTGKEGTARYRR
ncbi:hypothetical protein ACOQFL_08420 [Actinopolyspora sp. H202]